MSLRMDARARVADQPRPSSPPGRGRGPRLRDGFLEALPTRLAPRQRPSHQQELRASGSVPARAPVAGLSRRHVRLQGRRRAARGRARLHASVSQYGFLISCESRISLHNSGPYKLADDREMNVRDFMDLSESDFPWLDGVARDVPYNNLTVTMAVKDCHFYLVDDWGCFESKPEFTSDKLVGVGLYTSDALSESYQPVAMGSREELTACFKSLTDKVKDATNSLWKRIAGWSRDQMIDAGAITYFSIVKDLAHVAGVYDVGDWMTLDERAERFQPLFNDEYSLDALVGLCIGAHP